MSLKDFRPEPADFDDGEPVSPDTDTSIQASSHQEEINTLKIDKLSNRITIISIIIPCLIGAILVFGYLDIKERVVDVDTSKQSQYEKISRQLDEKLNALDVKIAKNRYDLDNTLPDLEKKSVALEGQMTKKADSKALKGQVSKLEKRVAANARLSKNMNDKTLLTLKETQGKIDKSAKQIKDEITLFKEEFDARLLELSEYEQQIGELRRDLSLLDKKQKSMVQESISQTQLDETKTIMDNRIKGLESQLNTLSQKLNANISRFQQDLDLMMKTMPSTGPKSSGSNGPSPQINIDSSESESVKEAPLSN